MTIFLFCATGAWPQQWDTLVNMIPKYAEGLVAHHIIRPEAASRLPLYDWPRWRNADEDTLDTHDNERIGVLSMLAAASRAREEYLCYRAANDSLQRVAPLKLSVRPKEKDMEQTGERWWAIKNARCGNSPVEREAWQFNMDWMQVAPAVYAEFKQIEENSSTIDLHLYSIPLSELIDDLREIGLLDSVLAAHLSGAVRSGDLVTAEDLFSCAASGISGVSYDRKKRLDRRKLMETLVGLRAMSPESAATLDHYVDRYDHPDEGDIAAACHGSVILDSMIWHGNDIISAYRMLFGDMHKVLGDALDDDLQLVVDTIHDTLDDRYTLRTLAYVKLRYGFAAHGRQYGDSILERVVQYEGRPSIDRSPYPLLNCVNKALCDQGAEQRMWLFLKGYKRWCNWAFRPDHVLLKVDTPTASAWCTFNGWALDTSNAGRSGFPMHLSAAEIRSAVQDFQAAGVLTHLTAEQIDSSEALANMTLRASWGEVFRFFPDLLTVGVPEHYWIGEGEPESLFSLSRRSHGVFKPTRVRVTWRNKSGKLDELVSMKFTLNDKRFAWRPSDEKNTFSSSVEMINDALAQARVNGRFCPIKYGERLSFIFLDRAQYDALYDKYLSHFYNTSYLWGARAQ